VYQGFNQYVPLRW
jgi:uncharacterized protein (TIGR02611 family)